MRSFAIGFFRAYPFFSGVVALSLVRGIISVTANFETYRAFFFATQWPLAVLEAAAVVEAFWAIATHFRKIRGFGWALMGVITAVALLAAAAVGLLRGKWNGELSGSMLFAMYTYAGLLVAALLSFAFFRQFRSVPIRPNAIRHVLTLCLLFGTYFIGNCIGQVSRGNSRFLPNFLINAGAVAAFGWWAIAMNRAGEQLPFAPAAEISHDEFEAAEAEHRASARVIADASAEALRRLPK